MTLNQATSPDTAADVQWCAEQMMVCKYPDEQGWTVHIKGLPDGPIEIIHPLHCPCKGSGTVARFEKLRRDCPNPLLHKAVDEGSTAIWADKPRKEAWWSHSDCEACHGLGWLLIPEAEARAVLEDWVLDQGGEVFLQKRESGIYCQIRWPSTQPSIPSAIEWFDATKDMPLAALAAAVRRCIEGLDAGTEKLPAKASERRRIIHD